MNKTTLRVAILSMAMALGVAFVSCGNEDSAKTTKKETTAKTQKKATEELPNYRYVDLDTVLSRYNLAKDYNEEMIRMQTNMENEVKRHENSIAGYQNKMQNKMQNNGYLSEESYKQDLQQLGSMQNNAQQSVARLQSNFEKSAMQAQKTVNDSIEAFIKDYNKTRGYDAILFKAATLYINPALDITDEVVEGLNARYNKVKK